MGVVESASRLFELLASKDDTFTRHLRPGLAEDRIREIVGPAGVELPREAIEFYGGMSTIPAEYLQPGDRPQCGMIVVWTRVPPSGRKRKG